MSVVLLYRRLSAFSIAIAGSFLIPIGTLCGQCVFIGGPEKGGYRIWMSPLRALTFAGSTPFHAPTPFHAHQLMPVLGGGDEPQPTDSNVRGRNRVSAGGGREGGDGKRSGRRGRRRTMQPEDAT
jgi:hypothetical protein